jgi:hypothetical protein
MAFVGDDTDCRGALANMIMDAVIELHLADDKYGCGFYDDARWLTAYELTRALVGLPEK